MEKEKTNDDTLLQSIWDGNSPPSWKSVSAPWKKGRNHDLGKRSGVMDEGQDQWPLTSSPLPGEA
ncbi:MAG: hypothetical protein WAN11_03210 [Syntrophobacteraceae bacterium]